MSINLNVGICFGGYCPMHKGHLDVIMKAKKENDICYVFVCGCNNEPRADEISLPLRRRTTLVKKFFNCDEQIRVREINDSELGIDESCSDENWKIWGTKVYEIISNEINGVVSYNWYVGEKDYADALERNKLINACQDNVILIDRKANPISATQIRKNPIENWNNIVTTFRPHFSTNILITGTASEGKSTLTKDIARYFGMPYMDEYGRTYMKENCKDDVDLTVNDFIEFLIEQRRQSKQQIDSPANKGLFISDTDNLVTLMYAKAYSEDSNIDLSKDDYYNILEPFAKTLQRGIKWDKIFLIKPHAKFVDDGTRYMAQSSIEERTKNYNILLGLIEEFGWKDKVVILDGTYYENFVTVKDYINSKLNCE